MKTITCEHIAVEKSGISAEEVKKVAAQIPLGKDTRIALCHTCWATVYAAVLQQVFENIGRGIAQDSGFRNLFKTLLGAKAQPRVEEEAKLAS
jgi:hypothetical protein